MLLIMWSILIVTLPSQPNAVRLRIWRALKALGCVALRDGAYLLPEALAPSLDALATEVREHGGTASVLTLSPRDDAQRDEVLAQFDRSEAYAVWRNTATALQLELGQITEPDARRRLRAVSDALHALHQIDHYPGAAAEQAEADLGQLRRAFDACFSRGEPQALTEHNIPTLDPAKFQGKRWATRARPWVDRLACAWLIQRFIDPQAELIWLTDAAKAPRGVLGYDYDGARFSHVGARVSFEVLMASFSLTNNAALQRIAKVVHYLDVGGIPAPLAPGLEGVLAGLRALHPTDCALVAASHTVFDALYAAPNT